MINKIFKPHHMKILNNIIRNPGIIAYKSYKDEMNGSQATRILDFFEYKGLIESDKLGRSRCIYPTKKGIQVNKNLNIIQESLR